MAKFTSKTESTEVAIHGISTDGPGGVFQSQNKEGIVGTTKSQDRSAVAGFQRNSASTGAGIYGKHEGKGAGVVGINEADANTSPGPGGYFYSKNDKGLIGETDSLADHGHAIVGVQKNPTSKAAGIYAEHIAGLTAGFFKGDVIITGDLRFPGADCAEDFTIKEEVIAEPGTVMALSETGELVPCVAPYEKKVAGVIAGAGSLRPGIIMDKQEQCAVRRQPIALLGKVFCKVDATYGAIEVGDLLTTSATQGHAMKVCDPIRAFGAVIGKAMASLGEGCGLIPILISLQ